MKARMIVYSSVVILYIVFHLSVFCNILCITGGTYVNDVKYEYDPKIIENDKVRVALTIDDNSYKDLVISMQSALRSAFNSLNVHFHIVTCGKDIVAATILAAQAKKSIENCFGANFAGYEIRPFTLPTESGFYKQMMTSKTKSHWNSPSGADMARFFLPQLFPTVNRLLYVDNDVTISCCLDEVYMTNLRDKVIGVALDDLKWATTTQFHNHYNASHPFVIKNMRRGGEKDLVSAVTADEFYKALPRYPNDGVLLIAVKRYNELKVYEALNEIALANSGGDYVVGLGTQQFTVLSMWDNWVELTPRANLRHFPDMARGYLMWFYYNGFLHFAGASKPRIICSWKGVNNEHRLHTYTPWATVISDLAEKCPLEKSTDSLSCAKHIYKPKNIVDLIRVVSRVIELNKEPQLVYLKVGEMEIDLSRYDYLHSLECFHSQWDSLEHTQTFHIAGHSKNHHNHHGINSHSLLAPHHGGGRPGHDTNQVPHLRKLNLALKHADILADLNSNLSPNKLCNSIHFIDRLVLHNSSWSGRMLHWNKDQVVEAERLIQETKYPRNDNADRGHGLKKNKNKKEVKERVWKSRQSPFCMLKEPLNPGNKQAWGKLTCKSILEDFKDEGGKHWEIIGISIDIQIPENKEVLVSPSLMTLDLDFCSPHVHRM